MNPLEYQHCYKKCEEKNNTNDSGKRVNVDIYRIASLVPCKKMKTMKLFFPFFSFSEIMLKDKFC